MRSRRIGLIVGALLAAACSASSSEPKTATSEASTAAESQGPKRVIVTAELLANSGLSPTDLMNLQLYLKGRIVLRRATAVGVAGITERHTLKVVDGKSVEEIVVESGTPGVVVGSAPILVNFDPEEPEAGFELDIDRRGSIVLLVDEKPGEPPSVEYGGQRWELVAGERARLEIEAEKLRDYVTNRRQLPGTTLP